MSSLPGTCRTPPQTLRLYGPRDKEGFTEYPVPGHPHRYVPGLARKPPTHNHNFCSQSRLAPPFRQKVHSSHIRQFDCLVSAIIIRLVTIPRGRRKQYETLLYDIDLLLLGGISRSLSIPPSRRLSSSPRSPLWEKKNLDLFANHLGSLTETAIMGISRDSRHKRSATGAKRAYYRS